MEQLPAGIDTDVRSNCMLSLPESTTSVCVTLTR